jgi:hypothetical protein
MKKAINKLCFANITMAMVAYFITSFAHAVPMSSELITDPNNQAQWLSVEMLGLQNGASFVRFKVNASLVPSAAPLGLMPNGATCAAGVLYVDLTPVSGRLIYQQLLLAKTTDKRVSRVNYTQDGAGSTCYIALISQFE